MTADVCGERGVLSFLGYMFILCGRLPSVRTKLILFSNDCPLSRYVIRKQNILVYVFFFIVLSFLIHILTFFHYIKTILYVL